jgi:hypothetical protein
MTELSFEKQGGRIILNLGQFNNNAKVHLHASSISHWDGAFKNNFYTKNALL